MKFLVFKFLSALFYLTITSLSHAIEPPDINNIIINKDNKSYENVIFKDVNNQDINLDDFKNKLVIINFWATWCAPCKKEMLSLDRLYQDKNFKNLQVFAVNMEQPNKLKTKKFFTDLNIQKLEIFFDGNLNFVKQFKLRGVPTTVLINEKGEEFARILGEINFQDEKFLKWLSKYE